MALGDAGRNREPAASGSRRPDQRPPRRTADRRPSCDPRRRAGSGRAPRHRPGLAPIRGARGRRPGPRRAHAPQARARARGQARRRARRRWRPGCRTACASRTGSARTSARPRNGSTASSAPKARASGRQRLGGVVEQRTDVDELRALAGAAPVAGRGEVLERERGAPELEVDRGGALFVLERVEPQPRRAERAPQLVTRVRDERRMADEPRLQQRGERAAEPAAVQPARIISPPGAASRRRLAERRSLRGSRRHLAEHRSRRDHDGVARSTDRARASCRRLRRPVDQAVADAPHVDHEAVAGRAELLAQAAGV